MKTAAEVEVVMDTPESLDATRSEFLSLVESIKGHDIAPDDVPTTVLMNWHRGNEGARRKSFARGFLIGRALAAMKATLKYGEVEATAARLGVTPQTVNNYIRGHAAIARQEEAESGFSIPDDYSFSGWVARGCPEPGDGIYDLNDHAKGKNPRHSGNGKAKASRLADRWLTNLGDLLLKEIEGLDAEAAGNLLCSTAGELREALVQAEAGEVTPELLNEVVEQVATLLALSSRPGGPPEPGKSPVPKIEEIEGGGRNEGSGAGGDSEMADRTASSGDDPAPESGGADGPNAVEPGARLPLHEAYAPANWEEVVGHAEVKATLRGHVESRTRQHVLLVGPSGTGKTTMARLYARALLCERPAAGTACGTCPPCTDGESGLYFQSGSTLTVSGTSDDPGAVLRHLSENIGYCKVVVINEADRLLSKSLRLISLMEQYPNVVFVLTAITDQEFKKFGDGQLNGRCPPLRLQPLSDEEVSAVLDRAYRAETGEPLPAELRAEVLSRLVENEAQGRARDALQALDSCLAARRSG